MDSHQRDIILSTAVADVALSCLRVTYLPYLPYLPYLSTHLLAYLIRNSPIA